MRPLTCEEFVELVTEYLEGALDRGTAARITEHLSLCDDCGRYLEQFGATVHALGHLPAADKLPVKTRDDLLAAFRRHRA